MIKCIGRFATHKACCHGKDKVGVKILNENILKKTQIKMLSPLIKTANEEKMTLYRTVS